MKSNVSDYLGVVQAIYEDACSKCVADVSDLRDLRTVRSRVKQEGLSFLTITLPSFGKDLDRALDQGLIDSTMFRSFRKIGSIPAFLQGMTSLLFDVETGRIFDDTRYPDPSTFPTIVNCVRQFVYAFKKVELPCTPERVHRALESFVETERSFEMFTLPREDIDSFANISSLMWAHIMGAIRTHYFKPRHGPGATAERISGNKKFVWKYWHQRLESTFPFLENAYGSIRITDFLSEEFETVTFLPPDQEIPSRVCLVPKTLKTPRVIAVEPSCMQYAQQGLRDAFYRVLESHPLTRGHINFRDQSINQRLAISSSKSGRLATIDLSDASDRVPLSLVKIMFQSSPELWACIDACRSRSARLPDGRLVSPLRKLASMGSALCFPIEAMYFYTICVKAILEDRNLPFTTWNIHDVTRQVFVYGDDIVVPTKHATAVLDHLQKYNCKVNTAKTFYTGKFRESCGVDVYNGYEITPIYVTQPPPRNRRQSSEIISWVATGNQFFRKGWFRSARFFFEKVESVLKDKLPFVPEGFSGLGRISHWGIGATARWNPELMRLEVRAYVPEPIRCTDELGGIGALHKSLSVLSNLKSLDDERDMDHLSTTALHGAVALKHRWVPL